MIKADHLFSYNLADLFGDVFKGLIQGIIIIMIIFKFLR